MTTYNEVIPQNLQNELIAIRDSISQNFWDIGDISLMVCNYVDDNDIPVSRDFVWRAVGAFVGLLHDTKNIGNKFLILRLQRLKILVVQRLLIDLRSSLLMAIKNIRQKNIKTFYHNQGEIYFFM